MRLTLLNISILSFAIPYFALLTSCSTSTDPNGSHKNPYCVNQAGLFSIPDSLKIIDIDFGDSDEGLLALLTAETDIDSCWNKLAFGLPLAQNFEPVRVYVLNECPDHLIRLESKTKQISVLVNQFGQVLIDGEPLSIDSLQFSIKANLNVIEIPEQQEILVLWDRDSPRDSLKAALIGIVEGFLLKQEELALEEFSTSICSLNESQIHYLSEVLPMNIRLGIGRYFTPPP